MKKHVFLACILGVFIIVCGYILKDRDENIWLGLNGNGELYLRLLSSNSDQVIYELLFVGPLWDYDGALLENVPELNAEVYDGWYYFDKTKEYREEMQLPVYEDMTLYVRKISG